MQVLMTAAAAVKSLVVWLTEHHSMQSDVPIASISCTTAIGRAGSTACTIKIRKQQGHALLASLWSNEIPDCNCNAASVQQEDSVSRMIRDDEEYIPLLGL